MRRRNWRHCETRPRRCFVRQPSRTPRCAVVLVHVSGFSTKTMRRLVEQLSKVSPSLKSKAWSHARLSMSASRKPWRFERAAALISTSTCSGRRYFWPLRPYCLSDLRPTVCILVAWPAVRHAKFCSHLHPLPGLALYITGVLQRVERASRVFLSSSHVSTGIDMDCLPGEIFGFEYHAQRWPELIRAA